MTASNAEAVECTDDCLTRAKCLLNRCVLRIVFNKRNVWQINLILSIQSLRFQSRFESMKFEITVSYSRHQISLTRCVFKIVVKQIVFRRDAAVWSMHKALINVNSLRRAKFRASNAAITDQSISWWTELIIEGANYVAFMWSSKTIIWSKLATSIDTYIWAVCSYKCKSHAMNMNIWLYRQFVSRLKYSFLTEFYI